MFLTVSKSNKLNNGNALSVSGPYKVAKNNVTDIILSRLRDLRHYLRCINSSLFCYDIARVVGIFC